MQQRTDRQRKSSRESFGVSRTGVWLGNDPAFPTAAVYQKSAQPTAANADDRSEGHCVLPVANNRQLGRALQTEVEWQERGNPGSTEEIRPLHREGSRKCPHHVPVGQSNFQERIW